MNHHVDKGFYPLGSCTMKYNPKVNEDMARLPGFAHIHPFQPEETIQGALQLMYELGRYLCEIAGMDDITLQPAAGAHGELTALLMIRAYHASRGNPRSKVILPDSAHGTNPASVVTAGYTAVQIKSNEHGLVNLDHLREAMDDEVAAVMLTNPNTLGLFEEDICEIARVVHDAGGLVYYDGANLNAILGVARPGDMGFDIVHANLHKTFATPHGGGGPGSGPVAVVAPLARYLPGPLPVELADGSLGWEMPEASIGRVHGHHGNFLTVVRALAYMRALGGEGLRRVAERSVLNARYLASLIAGDFDIPFPEPCMHEFVASAKRLKRETGLRAADVAKALLDQGFHAPTMYFPLIVDEALMVEPTETESPETLEALAAALQAIVEEARGDPSAAHAHPRKTPVARLDDAAAARHPVLTWFAEER